MAGTYTIHEREIEAKSLPGRDHKMIVGPGIHGPVRSMCGGVAVFPPKTHAPAHAHQNEEEVLYVLSGRGNFYFDGVAEAVESGTMVAIPSGVEHSIENTGDQPLKVVYIFSPPVAQGSYDRPGARAVPSSEPPGAAAVE